MPHPAVDHPISVRPLAGQVTVRHNGVVVAKSEKALALDEATYARVLYLPREDARMAHFERTDHATHCPFKGDASYYSLVTGERRDENAVWTYETPIAAVAAIKDHLAFYPETVEIEVAAA